jgi:hypothetical protein
MTTQTKTIHSYLLDKDSKEIVTEATVEISLFTTPDKQAEIKGTITTKGFTPLLQDKSYILKLNERISGRVRMIMQPVTTWDFDPSLTRFKVFFEDNVWNANIEWFESL